MKNSKWVILLNLLLLLGYFIFSVIRKEKLLSDGQLVLLELAPVDPRSLIQGDYMQLNYRISRDAQNDSISKRGYFVVELDKNNVAKPLRVQQNRTPLHSNEYLIEYTAPSKWDVQIGAESYFFQEGRSAHYDSAKYGALKINRKGSSVLVGLYDHKFQQLK